MPKISIVLPTYNGEKYIGQSINSVLQQTFKDWELIIVDDCSTDATCEIINQYAKNDCRIKVIHNRENQKLPRSLNIGFDIARGEYLTWTSDDNLYLPNALETMYSYLAENQNLYMVCADMQNIDQDGNIINISVMSPNSSIFIGNYVGACFMYKRCILDTIGKYDSQMIYVEDYDYWLRISMRYGEIARIHDVLYKYRRHNESLTAQKADLIRNNLTNLRKKHLGNIIEALKRNKPLLCQFYYCAMEMADKEELSFLKIHDYIPQLSYEKIPCNDEQKYIVLGAGEYGGRAVSALKGKAIYFADNDSNKVGKTKSGIEIVSFEKMKEYAEQYWIMIAASPQYLYEMLQQLCNNGLYHFCTYQYYVKHKNDSAKIELR